MTFVASVEFSHLDFFFATECGFLQRDLHVIAQIRTAVPLLGTFRAATKKSLKNSGPADTPAEHLTKNIEWIMKTATTEATATLRKRGMSKSVVGRAFFRIDQNIISFADLFEFLLRVLIVGIFVRMIFDREFSIGAFDFIATGRTRNFQHFVIVALGRRHYLTANCVDFPEFKVIAPVISRSESQSARPLETTTVAGRSNRSFKR